MELPICRIPLSVCCVKRRATINSFTHVLEGGKLMSPIFRVFVPIVFSAQSLVVNVEEVVFQSREEW